jgi:hypothetical protein
VADPAIARRRRAAVLVAIALPISMLAPWYTLRVSAPGLHGFTQSLTGWDQLSAAALVCLLAAVGVCALVVVRAALRVSGLGADARRVARARTDGALIAAAGLLCVVMLLWTAVSPPSVAAGAATASTHMGVRFGVLLTLVLAAVLTTLGVQITAAAGRTLRDRRTSTPRIGLVPVQPAPGRSQSQKTRLSEPIMKIPSTISQRKRVM